MHIVVGYIDMLHSEISVRSMLKVAYWPILVLGGPAERYIGRLSYKFNELGRSCFPTVQQSYDFPELYSKFRAIKRVLVAIM
jgi:hypothetical protein